MQPSSTAVAVQEQPAPVVIDHTQLPDEDGTFMRNFQEHPQSSLINECLTPRLEEVQPDGNFCIGCDSGIYFRQTQPPLDGCKAPDWFCVLGVPRMLNGAVRRSYVLWQEVVRPQIVIEYVSGDGSEEHDATPMTGKFWVYERAISVPYYVIYDVAKASIELYRLNGGFYIRAEPNAAGRYPIEVLRVEAGLWQGTYAGMDLPWLRFWDSITGQLLANASEREEVHRRRTEAERQRAEAERQRAETERQRAETAEGLLDDTRRMFQEECERAARLADRLRALGIDPDAS